MNYKCNSYAHISTQKTYLHIDCSKVTSDNDDQKVGKLSHQLQGHIRSVCYHGDGVQPDLNEKS